MSADKTVSNNKTISNFTNAKSMAKTLRTALADQSISLSHSTCLEIVAQQLGFANWNTYSAKLTPNEKQQAQPQENNKSPNNGDSSQATEITKPWSACSFCGKSAKEVKSLVGGCGGWEGFRARRNPESGERSNVFICDECATLIAKGFERAFGNAKDASTS